MHRQREDLIDAVARRIAATERPHPVRVAIDGVDGAGKTTFAEELAGPLKRLGRPVIRASVDGFHNPREIRYRRGRRSPEGFFHDSYDYAALTRELLEPLGPGGSRRYKTAVFDHRTNEPVDEPAETAPDTAVLLLDGLFLHRPELLPYWDMSIFLAVPFEVTAARMARRDGSSPHADAPEHRRYVQGQQLYLAACEPEQVATIVIDNAVVHAPRIVATAETRPAPRIDTSRSRRATSRLKGVTIRRGSRSARRAGRAAPPPKRDNGADHSG